MHVSAFLDFSQPVFYLCRFLNETIVVTYHTSASHITATTREFEKPQQTDKRIYVPIQPEMVVSFQVSQVSESPGWGPRRPEGWMW